MKAIANAGGGWRRLSAGLACGWLLWGAPEPAPGEVMLNRLSNLRLIRQTADNTEAILVAYYQYDGLSGPMVRLVPVIERRGQPGVAPWFETHRVTVGRGWGFATFKVRYRPEAPGAPTTLITDKVTVNMMAGERRVILGVPFLRTINWGLAATEARESNAVDPASHEPPSHAAQDFVPGGTEFRYARFMAREQVQMEQAALPEPAAALTEAPAAEASLAAAGAAGESKETRLGLSASAPVPRAAWQERLTLGPGDVLNLALFGEPESSREAVPVGPDGRVSFLEAQDVLAAGRTIDELRAELDHALSKYRRVPRTLITPVSFGSKKYFMLGAVVRKGVFTLDRPLTIVEAVARAGGLEASLSRRRMVDGADLSRSFLARQGKHCAVDFEKLFQAGDLAQNILLEPGDYLYFPPGGLREVYVLGEVTRPGTVSFESDLTALRAIVLQGGFTPQAWKRKVAIVRGSLAHPELIEVNVAALLAAGAKDLPLQPRDIVYVSARPWVKVEELLDAAATAFVQSAVVTWTGLHAGPLIR